MLTVSAVVSLFNPDDGVLANAAALLKQVDHVVAVDDGSTEDPGSILEHLAAMGCSVARLPENSGIAAALNEGITLALGSAVKPDYILTMDQDSLLEDGYVDALLKGALAAEEAAVPAGLIAPASVRGLPVRKAGTENGIQLGGEPIQSGLLIPVPVLERIGLLRADLFIDGVDTEYYLRCLDAGLRTVLAKDAELGHALGSMSEASVFGRPLILAGKKVKVRTAATWRYYYIFRNRVLLTRAYGKRHPLWAVKGHLADFRHLAIVSVLAPGRTARLRAALAGSRDGLAGRTGKRPT